MWNPNVPNPANDAIIWKYARVLIDNHMQDARDAKAKGRPAVVAHYVRAARRIARQARGGRVQGTVLGYIVGR